MRPAGSGGQAPMVLTSGWARSPWFHGSGEASHRIRASGGRCQQGGTGAQGSAGTGPRAPAGGGPVSHTGLGPGTQQWVREGVGERGAQLTSELQLAQTLFIPNWRGQGMTPFSLGIALFLPIA